MFDITQDIKGIGLYLTNCMSQEDIDKIIELSKSPNLKTEEARIGHYVSVSKHTTGEEAFIFEKVNEAIEKAMDVYVDYYGLDLNDYTMADKVYWIKTWHVGIGIGHHQDSWEADGKEMVPAVTVLLYLSSDYEGGETIFVDTPFKDNPEKDIAIKPVAGSMIAFQAQVMHRVSTVTGGTRISTDINYMS
jgi:predicted 2-oxoglutarate/Fe(II)-dependent dioxygenase YbiX